MKWLSSLIFITSLFFIAGYIEVSALPANEISSESQLSDNLNPAPTSTPTGVPTPILKPTIPLTTTTTAPANCPVPPASSFLAIWQSDSTLQAALACPTSYHPRITPQAWEVKTSYQPFEHGHMIWSDHQGWYAQPEIRVLFTDGTSRRFDDNFDPATDSTSGNEEPPGGLYEPVMGFGKVWRENPEVRSALGWATAPETPGSGRYQLFMGGRMIWIDQTDYTYVFISQSAVDLVWVFDVPFVS
jgi:hypothetical protein